MSFHYLPFPLFGSLLLSACVATEPEPLGDVGDTGDTQGQSSTNTPADSGGQTDAADDNGGTQGATSTTDATGTTNATAPGSDDGNDTDGASETGDGISTGGDEPGTTEKEPVDCSELDEAACDAEPSCFGLGGQEILQNAQGFCYGPPQFLYCLDADVACPPATATVCSMGSFYEAWSACPLPGGWMACDPPGMVNGDC